MSAPNVFCSSFQLFGCVSCQSERTFRTTLRLSISWRLADYASSDSSMSPALYWQVTSLCSQVASLYWLAARSLIGRSNLLRVAMAPLDYKFRRRWRQTPFFSDSHLAESNRRTWSSSWTELVHVSPAALEWITWLVWVLSLSLLPCKALPIQVVMFWCSVLQSSSLVVKISLACRVAWNLMRLTEQARRLFQTSSWLLLVEISTIARLQALESWATGRAHIHLLALSIVEVKSCFRNASSSWTEVG